MGTITVNSRLRKPQLRYLIAVVGALIAAPVSADCPTRAALESGHPAYVAYPDGSVVDLILLKDGLVQETTRFGDHTGEFRMISQGGVFIVEEIDLDGDTELPNTRITTTYPPGFAGRLPVQPNESFSVQAMNSFADNEEPEEELIEIRTGGVAQVDIAGCRYDGFPMVLTYFWTGEYFTSMMAHIPSLGVSVEIARMDRGAEAEPFAPVHFSLQHP